MSKLDEQEHCPTCGADMFATWTLTTWPPRCGACRKPLYDVIWLWDQERWAEVPITPHCDSAGWPLRDSPLSAWMQRRGT